MLTKELQHLTKCGALKSGNIEPLLLRIERSQLRWFGRVSKMPLERLFKQTLLAKANGRRSVGQTRTRWTNYIEDLRWNRLGLYPSQNCQLNFKYQELNLLLYSATSCRGPSL